CSPDPPLPSSARLSLSAAPPFISRRSAAARALHSFPTRRSSDLVAVTSLGHAHPEIAAVIAEQAGALLHTSNVFRIDWQEQLGRSEEHTSELQSRENLVCRLLLEKKKSSTRHAARPTDSSPTKRD